MKKLALTLIGASALFGTAAVAAPLTPAVTAVAPDSNIEQVRMVCKSTAVAGRNAARAA